MNAVTQLKPKKKKPAGFMDTMKSTATAKKPAKTKSEVPVLKDAPLEVRQAVDKHVDAKKREKEAIADKDASGATILAYVKPIQDEDGFKGKFRHSYAVPGTKKQSVKFVSSNRFTINADDSDEIEEILGDDFDELIEQKFSVSLKAEVFEDDDLQKELMEMLGDRFTDFLETTTSIKVAEGFDQRAYRIGKEALANLRIFCRQYKPSLR